MGVLKGFCRLAAGLLLAVPLASGASPPRLHVPSPDWRDQVIYFVMTDRFADGDPANNDQGANEFDPRKPGAYSGGDLRGLTARLDYVRGLGATALWVTPPNANQWTVPYGEYTGFHGYWPEHFTKVDRHLGTLADYQRLSRELHARDMYLVQDIVLNHTGDYFHYAGGWDPADPARFYTRNVPGARGAPSQPPFHLNDPRREADRRAAIYHWTPNITDFNDPDQVARFQMSGLDDLNTESPAVRRALRASYGHWIREAGVDAFRVDTIFYVPPDFFDDFLYSRDPRAPGIDRVARATGRDAFHVFGEGFGIDRPGAERETRRIDAYMTGPGGARRLPGMLNFPLYGALGDAFARGHPTSELAQRVETMLRVHARPHLMPTFIDNHDVDRFLAGGSEAALRQALLALMTLPGIPVIYYGTEQGFREQRGSMFAAGYGSGGRDRYDTGSPLYRHVAAVTHLRRAHKLFSRGVPEILRASVTGPGVIAWRTRHEGESAIVVFNTADEPVLLDNLETGLAPGTTLEGLFAIGADASDVVVGEGGRVTLRLAPRAARVWKVGAPRAMAAAPPSGITLDPFAAESFRGDFTASGRAPAGASLALVVDGDLPGATRVAVGGDGRWQATIDTSAFGHAATPHRLVAWDEGAGAASESRTFRVERPWTLLAEAEDPEGDDHGPAGAYAYPTDASWGPNRQMDLRRVRVFGAGGSLRIELTMRSITTPWNPPNGFDHVAFVVFVQMPGRDGGAREMPFQLAALPEGMRWHYRLRAHGWSNALFSWEGASATSDGRAVAPAASIGVDRAARTVSFTLPAASLGRPATFSGAKVYATTWDYDGGFRAMTREPTAFGIGGGDPERDARVMDASAVIPIP